MGKHKKKLIIAVSIVLVFAVLAITFGVLFSLKNVNIVYATTINKVASYDKNDMIEKSELKNGTNLVLNSFDKNVGLLEQNFPYAKFNIVRVFPNTINIYVYEREAVFRIYDSVNGFWQIYDEDLKCLDKVAGLSLTDEQKKIPTLSGKELNLVSKAGLFVADAGFKQTLTTIIDGVYGAGGTKITDVMCDIALSYNQILDLDIFTLTIASDEKENAGKIIIQGKTNLKQKIAYATYLYLNTISHDGEYISKPDKARITVWDTFDLSDQRPYSQRADITLSYDE